MRFRISSAVVFFFYASLAVLFTGLSCLSVAGEEPPDSQVNPLNCEIHTVSTAPNPERHNDINVEFTIDPGPGLARSTIQITSNARDDLAPKIAIADDGINWVVWWRDASTDHVLIRERNYLTEEWSEEISLSESNESSRNPEIIYDGASPWVVFEIEKQVRGTSIAVVEICTVIHDAPEPVGHRHVVDETDWDGEVDARVHYEESHLWITWIHDDSYVGCVFYDYEDMTWSTTAFVPYIAGDVEYAREWIHDFILEN